MPATKGSSVPLIEKTWVDYLAIGVLTADLEVVRTGYKLDRVMRKLAVNDKHRKKCVKRMFETYGGRVFSGAFDE